MLPSTFAASTINHLQLNMKRILIILAVTFFANSLVSNATSLDPDSDKAVIIYPDIQTNMLSIEVDETLTGKSITVSVFNSVGEIVLENTLGLGLNKISVVGFAKGEYVAVVRENGVYTGKSSFEVK